MNLINWESIADIVISRIEHYRREVNRGISKVRISFNSLSDLRTGGQAAYYNMCDNDWSIFSTQCELRGWAVVRLGTDIGFVETSKSSGWTKLGFKETTELNSTEET